MGLIRPMSMRVHPISRLMVSAGLLLTAGCTSARATAKSDDGALTRREHDFAVVAARQQLDKNKDATVSAAYAALRPKDDGSSNTGHPCPARVIHVTIAGDFPNIAISPPPGQDPQVTGVIVDVDPTTGASCLVGVTTAPDLTPAEGSADLLPALQ